MALVGLDRADDRDVWEHARLNDYVLVSKDGDFRQLAFLHGAPPKVVSLQIGNSPTSAAVAILKEASVAIEEFVVDSEEALLIFEREEVAGLPVAGGDSPATLAVVIRPAGTVTFLFTDIEGSTRRWEADAEAMRAALVAHDGVLRSAVEGQGGWLFKQTGDGVCAAFSSARAAVDAAINAQRSLGLPVRMGIATGEAEQRGDDYFGPALNRAARVMAVGHGGQILVSASTAGLVSGLDLVDLGEHRLRDLSGVEHLFQVRAEGLGASFPPLRTVDAVPGNLPAQVTSFVGRELEVKELAELVREHRLLTLTGVGGVGKTRLAVQVAAELVPDFGDGVWLVELAPVGDPAAAPDAVATALGITAQAGLTVTATVAQALSGRRLLIILDNCEHVLDVAADLVAAILARASTVKVIATSREGLRVEGEHLWSVPSLDTGAGAYSAAVELFVERARGVVAGFSLDSDADAVAVTEICRRLDGIALAIELAAARMVSMSPAEVLTRLTDRFRLLSGPRRGLERHQTLHHAVQWSYDLLDGDERMVLLHGSLFAGGFDLAAVPAVVGAGLDEYTMLDVLDSLVRKSLVTAGRVGVGTRYGLLETIRQFAEDQLAATGAVDAVRDRHARYYAEQAVAQWSVWDGPGYRGAADWLDAEFANLRAGFRWATDRGDLVTATAIAAHSTVMAMALNRFEPVEWAEELLPMAVAADVTQLPRLLTAAACCLFVGRPEEAVAYAEAAVALEADPRYQPLGPGWSRLFEAVAHMVAGRMECLVEIGTAMAAQPGNTRLLGLSLLTSGLSMIGRPDEALVIADEALVAARAHGNNPFSVAMALYAYGRAFTETDPLRALDVFRHGLTYCREHRVVYIEAAIAQDAAGLEALHGDLEAGLALFDATIDSFHQAGATTDTVATLATLAIFFDRFERPDLAATIYGMTTSGSTSWVVGVTGVVDHLRTVLGTERFEDCVAAGAAMELADAVRYARQQIRLVRAARGSKS